MLNKGGRIAIITFNGTEEHIVRNAFRELESDCICPKNLPCTCNKVKEIEIITKKPLAPGEKELSENSRSLPARLRVAEKL
jgi:16S rRNA (cytosine1402-N4)-methyltransferase